MKQFFAIFISFLLLTPVASAQADLKLELGAKLPRKYASKKNGLTMVNPGQLDPSIVQTIKGVTYTIAYTNRSYKITMIQTADEDFQTANGLKVDSEITLTREQVEVYPYWEIRGPVTPDGWYPVIGVDMPMVGREMLETLEKTGSVTTTISRFTKAPSNR